MTKVKVCPPENFGDDPIYKALGITVTLKKFFKVTGRATAIILVSFLLSLAEGGSGSMYGVFTVLIYEFFVVNDI
ncbi:MAG: hypothetical protein WC587_01280 [Candidatus Paceibacterota bacterium]